MPPMFLKTIVFVVFYGIKTRASLRKSLAYEVFRMLI